MSTTISGSDPRSDADEQCIHVVGGCHVGRDVASRLAGLGLTVHLHDHEPPADHADEFEVHETPSYDGTLFTGHGLDTDSVLFAVHPSDSTNLLLAQVARSRFGVDRVIARVNDPRRIPAFEAAGIQTIDAAAVLGQMIADRC